MAKTTIGNLSVGETIKMNVGGVAKEFIIVHQGKPSSLYDSSCDGTWLLMKDLYAKRAWDSSYNDYANSDIHAYLNGTFLGMFDSDIQSAIKQVKLPYQNGTGSSGSIASGSSGLSTKIFLLSAYESGRSSSSDNSQIPADGVCLDYFIGTSTTDSKRVGYYNGTATNWWLRSPAINNAALVWYIGPQGSYGTKGCSNSYGIRPAMILPSNITVENGFVIPAFFSNPYLGDSNNVARKIKKVYFGNSNNVAIKVKKAYIGVTTEFPIYEETTTTTTLTNEPITDSNIRTYFDMFDGSPYGYWDELMNEIYIYGNGENSQSYMYLRAKYDMSVTFNYEVSSEEGCDVLYVYTASGSVIDVENVEELILEASGIRTGTFTYSLTKDQALVFVYGKDGSVDEGEDCAWIRDIKISGEVTVTSKVQVGIETKSVAQLCYIFEDSTSSGDGGSEVTGVQWKKYGCDIEYSGYYANEGQDCSNWTTTDSGPLEWSNDYGWNEDEGYYPIIEDEVGSATVSDGDGLDGYYVTSDTVWYIYDWDGDEYTLSGVETCDYYEDTYYSKNSSQSYGTITAEEGALPENGTLLEGSATDSYCIVEVNGTEYYYEKIT